MSKDRNEGHPKKKRHIFRSIVIFGLFAMMAGGITLAFVLASFGSYDDALLHNDPQTTLLYDAEENLILSAHGSENRIAISVQDIPPQLRNAFLAAEDLRFYDHMGFDVIRIIGALWADIRSGSLDQGASTITQQLVKNTHLSPEKTWIRKLNEAYFAFQIEQDYSKDEILMMYMNHVYLGNGAYGVQAAAQAYFGVDVGELSLTQAASIAAILKAPSNYAPHIMPDNNKRRRDLILSTMLEENMISAAEAQSSLNETLAVIDREQEAKHGWFTDMALDEAGAALGIGYDELLGGGYRIYTTLDTQLQNSYEELFSQPDRFPADAADGERAQAALVATNVKTGAIRAIVGGREYAARRALNRAAAMRRQPGSALKPFAVYAPAIERAGLTPTTFLEDQPVDFDGYAPRNFGDSYSGWITARTALAKSLNIPAVLIMNQLGVDIAREYVKAFEIPLDDRDIYLPLALGAMTNGVSPVELCAAYAALGNGGEWVEPHTVVGIRDASGKLVYEARPRKKTALSEKTAYLLTDMLRSGASWGSAAKLGAVGVSVAAKTGTVMYEGDLNRDAWTAAFTPETAIVTWMGFDSTDSEHALGKSVTGGGLPAALAAQALAAAQTQDVPFAQPEGIEHVLLDKRALENEHVALRATEWTPKAETVTEVYLTGTAPTQYAGYWVPPQTPRDLKVEKGVGSYPVISFTSQSADARYRLYRIKEEENAVEIASLRGDVGEILRLTDSKIDGKGNYRYFIIPEHAEAVDLGVTAKGQPTAMVSITAPLLPFDLPNAMDDIFLTTPMPSATVTSPSPSAPPTPSPSATDTSPPSSPSATPSMPRPTPTPAPTPSSTPTPTPIPKPTGPLFG